MTETVSRPTPSFAGSTSTSSRGNMRVVTDVPSFTCPFTSSPNVISPRRTASPSPSRLSFPKMPIPSSSVCSTDSEILSDFDPRLSSPSLITSLFSRNPSSSCSTSSNPTPVTPTCGAKPILRRPGPECASTSTSASEDCGKLFERVGLGLSSMQVHAATEQKHQHHGLARKRSTLTFAVKCPVTSDSAYSPPSSFCRPSRPFSRSPCAAKLPAWHDDDEDMDEDDDDEDEDGEYGSGAFSPLFEEESDDDEGYQEDSEGGFTSDEECVGTFTDLPRIWVPSARWKATQNTPRRRGDARSESFTNTCTSDDGSVVYRPRGRKIMIATNKPDRCSRHVSPPPSRAASPARQSACPPAARSPSAIGLCRRRETAEAEQLDKTPLAGWRSDVPVSRGRGSACQPAGILRKDSAAPVPGVRRTYTQVSASTPCSSASRPCEKESLQLKRRVSAPACSAVSAQRYACQSQPRESDSAREGLEAYLRRGSDKS